MDDPTIFRWAEREDRIVVSLDRNTMASEFYEHLRRGHHSPGLFFLRRAYAIPDVVESLVPAAHAADPDERRDRVVYLPF